MKARTQTIKLLEKVLGHMDQMHGGSVHGGILLSGDPGIGKTTFVEQLASLLGLQAIVIEVPHMTEEHLINIPFVVFNPATNSTQNFASREVPSNEKEYSVVLAQSALFNHIVQARQMPDAEYIKHIKNSPGYIQDFYKYLGGDEKTIPDTIKQARNNFKAILFLDEYYRQTSPRIRNILRGILNNKIGIHQIPRDVYILYASNMKDAGLESIASNAQFTQVEYKTPSKNEWFDWFIAKFKDDKSVKLNVDIIERFKKELKDEHLSYTDIEKEVRTSPRRWEQLLLYINNSIPVASEKEAKAFLTNVKNNFIHYQTEEHSDLADKVLEAVVKLINDTSTFKKIDKSATLDPSEWRENLQHLIEAQKTLGKHRKHIPVVSGPPGIGKTSFAHQVAEKENLRLIDIDVSEINAEDVTGIPLPGKRTDENLPVKFSVPKLYYQIMDQIKEADAAHIAGLKKEHGKDADKYIEEYKKAPWKYLIFFDEINRTDEKTFNALRRVILEKNFGPSDDEKGTLIRLPKESIVVAALNPEGGGTTELTHHFRDVVDIVPAKASWTEVRTLLKNRQYKNVPESVKESSLQLIDSFVEKFKSKESKHGKNQKPFYLDVGTTIYMSPREYVDMFSTLVREINSGVKRVLHDADVKPETIHKELVSVIAEAFEDSLKFIFTKHETEPEEFMNMLTKWVESAAAPILEPLISKKAANVTKLSSPFEGYLEGKNITNMVDDIDIVNANDAVNNVQFIEQFKELLADKLKNDKAVTEYILSEAHPKVTLNKKGDGLVTTSDKTSLLTNFVLALLYTLHIHNYKNDRLMSIGKALSQAFSEIITKMSKEGKISEDVKHETVSSTVQLRSDIHDLMSKL